MPISGSKYEFTEKNVNNAPDEHGVYALYDDEILIYHGRAAGDGVTIRSRLQSHFGGDEAPAHEAQLTAVVKQPIRPSIAKKNCWTNLKRSLGACLAATKGALNLRPL